MKSKTATKNNEIVSFVRIVYTICALVVLFVGFSVWKSSKEGEISQNAHNGNHLLSREELQDYQDGGEIYYPPEWKILQQLEERHQKNQIARQQITIPRWNRKQITQDLNTISNNLEERSENLKTKPIPPLLRIQQQRISTQTFTSTDGESWNYPTVEPRTGSRATSPKIVERNLSKPSIKDIDKIESKLDEVLEIEPIQENEPKKKRDAQQVFTSPTLPNAAPNIPVSSEVEIPYNHEEGMQILRFFNQKARVRLETFSRDIQDYACLLYKWDATNNSSDGCDVMQIKLRETPFSIYSKSIFPKRYEGREWLYWEGHYDGDIVVFSGKNAWKRTLALKPDSTGIKNCAARSIFQLGFRRLLEELIEISENEATFKNSIIRYYPHAKVGEKTCYALEVTFPEVTEISDFYRIQIYIDEKLDLPIQLIIYDWPEEGKTATVMESYTYIITQLNPGFSDDDFCHLNPEYQFQGYIPSMSKSELKFMETKFPYFNKTK